MLRARLPWLLALPLMIAGSLAAHAVGTALAPGGGNVTYAEGTELAELHERSSSGAAGHTVLWLGLLAAIVAVIGIRRLVGPALGAASRGVGAGCFSLLPPLAFASQELIERLLHAESVGLGTVVEPRFLLGLAVQLPFAALAFALGRLLLRTGKRLLRLLGERRIAPLRGAAARLTAPVTLALPGVRALSRGHPLRGPPLLA